MFGQRGTYFLARNLSGKKQNLTHDSYHKSQDSIVTKFTSIKDNKQVVLLDFDNEDGCTARFLVNGVEYYPVLHVKYRGSKKVHKYYMYITNKEDHFIFKRTKDIHGRLYLFFPEGNEIKPKKYTFNSNISSFFHIKNASPDVIPEFANHLEEQVYLKMSKEVDHDCLSRDCTPDCNNKTNDNGCGLPCKCKKKNKRCKNKICGSHEELAKDINGELQCVPKKNMGYIVIWVIIAIIAFILLMFIFYKLTRRQK